jgi:hypothetical protein
MSRSCLPRIAIIGADMAGITCARELQALDCSPVRRTKRDEPLA